MLKNLIKLTLVFVVIICQNTSTALALFNYEFWCKKEPIEFSGEKTYPFDSLNEIDSYANCQNLDSLHHMKPTTIQAKSSSD